MAKRGEILIWHWAHRPVASPGGGGCDADESLWHLTWKSAYLSFPGWDVEVPFTFGGDGYRLDAAQLTTGRVREFVHSLSDKYTDKHRSLRRAGLDVMWIFDGDEFLSRRCVTVSGGGRRHLLRTKARQVQHDIGGIVHYGNKLWREWKKDIWYPMDGPAAREVIHRYNVERDSRVGDDHRPNVAAGLRDQRSPI